MAALLVGGVLLLREARTPSSDLAAAIRLPPIVGAGILLAGPGLAEVIAGRTIHANDATLALGLCPVVVAVAVRARGDGSEDDLTHLLWPSLAGIAGLLLLLPEPAFAHGRSWLGLAAMPVVVGLGASLYTRVSLSSPVRSALGSGVSLCLGLLLGAVLFGAAGWTFHHGGPIASFSFGAAGLDGFLALLTLLALRRLGPHRWTAQFLVVPFVAIVEGMILLHPILDWRSYVAISVLALSAGYQLLAMPSTDDEETSHEATDVPEA